MERYWVRSGKLIVLVRKIKKNYDFSNYSTASISLKTYNSHGNLKLQFVVRIILCFSKIFTMIRDVSYLEGKYTEWPNPQKAENHACDRQSGLNDSAP